jgi:hypothetical protein
MIENAKYGDKVKVLTLSDENLKNDTLYTVEKIVHYRQHSVLYLLEFPDIPMNIENFIHYDYQVGDIIKYFDSFGYVISKYDGLFGMIYKVLIISNGVFVKNGETLSLLKNNINLVKSNNIKEIN